ncbi:hypothetical protein PRIPAC_87505, partial [Pristionchus pacificus]|uniref:Uncharacterized protein n=1 Tax=Pristionchus pacificus TaxID=54126 RepID=A0A2A6CXS1_PRIPA
FCIKCENTLDESAKWELLLSEFAVQSRQHSGNSVTFARTISHDTTCPEKMRFLTSIAPNTFPRCPNTQWLTVPERNSSNSSLNVMRSTLGLFLLACSIRAAVVYLRIDSTGRPNHQGNSPFRTDYQVLEKTLGCHGFSIGDSMDCETLPSALIVISRQQSGSNITFTRTTTSEATCPAKWQLLSFASFDLQPLLDNASTSSAINLSLLPQDVIRAILRVQGQPLCLMSVSKSLWPRPSRECSIKNMPAASSEPCVSTTDEWIQEHFVKGVKKPARY